MLAVFVEAVALDAGFVGVEARSHLLDEHLIAQALQGADFPGCRGKSDVQAALAVSGFGNLKKLGELD
jgi:hypothetical protein